MLPIAKSDEPTDLFYRYMMPCLQIKHIKKNGGTTVVVNIEDVAKSLNVPPIPLLAFFSSSLGVKLSSNVLGGLQSKEILQVMLSELIDEFILCNKCGYPELDFSCHGKKIKKCKLIAKCRCCGCNYSCKSSNGSIDKFIKKFIVSEFSVRELLDKPRRSGASC
jgi:translation initiation factor 2 beta subunit (eIF-2beta)/eIF-5